MRIRENKREKRGERIGYNKKIWDIKRRENKKIIKGYENNNNENKRTI